MSEGGTTSPKLLRTRLLTASLPPQHSTLERHELAASGLLEKAGWGNCSGVEDQNQVLAVSWSRSYCLRNYLELMRNGKELHGKNLCLLLISSLSIQPCGNSVVETKSVSALSGCFSRLCLLLSPQECAPGYYRDTKGLFLGKCIPCHCNGHSDQCLPGSGICLVSKQCTSMVFWAWKSCSV